MPLLYPSTVEFIKLCVNMVLRAITVSVCWLALMGIGVVLNWALEYMFNATNAPAPIRDLFQPMTWGIPILLGVGIMATSLIDVFKLVKMSWESPYGSEDKRKMNAKLSEYVSFRDVPFALVCSVIWFVVLWAAGYPADERVGVAVIAYLAQWASRFVINGFAMFLLKRLNNRAAETIERLGGEIPQEIPPRILAIARVFAVLGVTFTFFAMTGLALSATVPIVSATGLTPLPAGFGIAGWGMLAAGGAGLTALFGVTLVLLTRTEAVAGGIGRIASGVNRPMKALGFAWKPNAAIANN